MQQQLCLYNNSHWICLSVTVRKQPIAILVRSSREISQTVRIGCHTILSRVCISVWFSKFFIGEKQAPTHECPVDSQRKFVRVIYLTNHHFDNICSVLYLYMLVRVSQMCIYAVVTTEIRYSVICGHWTCSVCSGAAYPQTCLSPSTSIRQPSRRWVKPLRPRLQINRDYLQFVSLSTFEKGLWT